MQHHLFTPVAIVNTPPTPRAFQPWKQNLGLGFKTLCLMGVAYGISKVFPWEARNWWTIQGLLALFAAWQFKQAAVRIFGQSLERRAIKKLASVVGNQNIRSNVVLPGKGDIDCVVRIEDKIFNVEIKAFRDTKRVSRAHLKQALDAANYLQSEPVIWLPNFKDVQFRERSGVQLCACDARKLFKKLK